MSKIRLYANITAEENTQLDELTKTLDYPSKTDCITAILRAAIYGSEPNRKLPGVDAIEDCVSKLDVLRAIFFEVLDEYAFPIVAMRGADNAYTILSEEMKTWMYDRCKTVPLYTDMKAWTRQYYSLKKSEIIQYRIQVMTDTYREENGITRPEETQETAGEVHP